MTSLINQQFKKEERLSSNKKIDLLFKEGHSATYGCIRCVYLISNEANVSNTQVLFSVPKRNFKNATDRNLLKRRMREAYRLNKLMIHYKLLIAMIYIDKEVGSYVKIENNLINLLKKLDKQLQNIKLSD